MNVENWFPTPIWYTQIEEIDNVKLSKYAKNLSKKSNGRILSNYGGWQSNDFHLDTCENEELSRLALIVLTKIQEAAASLNLKSDMQIGLSNFWININSNGNSNNLHNHPRSIFSAAYYVDAPENSGNIVFEHPSNFMNFWWQCLTNNDTFATYTNVVYPVSVGKLLIFPSWLKHFVEANQNKKPRISIAFNSCIA